MSSWQDYVDNQLIGAGLIQAAIYDNNNGQLLAASAGVNQPTIDFHTRMNNPNLMVTHGVMFSGEKYYLFNCEPLYVTGGGNEERGIEIGQTNTVTIVGIYPTGYQISMGGMRRVRGIWDFLRAAGN
ncbi:Profilin-1 [Cladobotryum mycophilum]|uniref:Profilin n=1 Tax=Cladobotryum mycophilum TaxID=491253 RepID=A0ABR0SWP9_9HYPO